MEVATAVRENKSRFTSESKEEELRYQKENAGNQEKQETEKERENRIRHERREKKYTQKELKLKLKYMQNIEEENIDEMESKNFSKEEVNMEGATGRRGKVSGDNEGGDGQVKQKDIIVETRGIKESESTIESHNLGKRGKRKSEADKEEENRKKKGKENEEQTLKEGSLEKEEGKIQGGSESVSRV